MSSPPVFSPPHNIQPSLESQTEPVIASTGATGMKRNYDSTASIPTTSTPKRSTSERNSSRSMISVSPQRS